MSIPKMSSDVEELYSIDGSFPSFASLPGGCTFGPRCPYFTEDCAKSEPKLTDVGGGHLCACHRRSGGTL